MVLKRATSPIADFTRPTTTPRGGGRDEKGENDVNDDDDDAPLVTGGSPRGVVAVIASLSLSSSTFALFFDVLG